MSPIEVLMESRISALIEGTDDALAAVARRVLASGAHRGIDVRGHGRNAVAMLQDALTTACPLLVSTDAESAREVSVALEGRRGIIVLCFGAAAPGALARGFSMRLDATRAIRDRNAIGMGSSRR